MIHVVSGFWRSGTSLLMQACEAGGMTVVRNETRDQLNERHSDASYRPNPVSLYEPSAADLQTVGFPRQFDGQVVKILVGWPMAVHRYRVAVLKRDPREIVESAARAFGEHQDAQTRDRWVAEYPRRFEEHLRALKNRRDVEGLTVVEFDELIAHPFAVMTELREDGWPLHVLEAAAVVQPSLRRVLVGA